MKTLLKLEEVAQFLLSIVVFSQLPFAWWWFPALILVPDLGMLGYLINPKMGAYAYNLVHHKAVAIALAATGFLLANPVLLLTGVILFGHSAMDRMMGYGLKYEDSFSHTSLGLIGKMAKPAATKPSAGDTRRESNLSIF
ncbi:DUF4260 domain-containing protein [Larkinella rosea]|uniref:DUF4260 family protein n=1 Tax=Larkinella rosea TaxID=2025312 RepID=A0A3P1C000_9BACT|nr:DUF4260 domain-containing protein [Larkinella rosea]RRB06568.1 DUF4260 family protein [Larkinella rosea]